MIDLSLEARQPRRRQFRYDPSQLRGEEVFHEARRHSGIVRWLKIVLPTLAVAGVVVFAVTIREITSDFADLFSLAGMAVDNKSLVMDKPHLSGFKGTEHSYEVFAERAVQDLTNPKVVRLEKIDAEFGLTSEVKVSLKAETGVFDGDKETLVLTDGITVSSTDGYAAKLDAAKVDLRKRTLRSQGPVEISSTDGRIRSQGLWISERGKKVSFSGGVSLTFVPPESPEAPAATPVSE